MSLTVAAIEGGGTTFVVSIAQIYPKNVPLPPLSSTSSSIDLTEERMRIIDTVSIPSTNPDETIQQCCQWLSSKRPITSKNIVKRFDAVGIACFGPLGVDSKYGNTYGKVLESSPKKEWRNVDVVTPILKACSADTEHGDLSKDEYPPFLLDTDVNAPALAEFHRSSSVTTQKTSLAYVTVGTGVGVGLIVNSKPVHGRMHPEGGHICVAPLPNDNFAGYSWGKQRSPYQGVHTVEGIASSVALTERILSTSSTTTSSPNTNNRDDLANLPDDHEIWDHAANALANLCVSLFLLLSIEEIVLGGGIMKRTILYEKIRKRTLELMNGYISLPSADSDDMIQLIRTPTWGDSTGLVGALILAKMALKEKGDIGNNKNENEACNLETSNQTIVRKYLFVSTCMAIIFLLGKPFLSRRK